MGMAPLVVEYGGFTVVNHHASRQSLKKAKGPVVTTEELLLGLAQSELDVEHAAVTEHGNKEGRPPAGATDGDHDPSVAGAGRLVRRPLVTVNRPNVR